MRKTPKVNATSVLVHYHPAENPHSKNFRSQVISGRGFQHYTWA